MRKRLLKLVSLAMVLALFVVSFTPGTVRAQGGNADQIKQQIRRTYSKALSMFRRSSFDGYCGPLVGYQLYILGVTTEPILRNGKDGYDTFCHQRVSSGGYGVRAYPAHSWTLREALDDITDNGTKDAYNILVGFQATPSAAGRKYGHSCVIHAIIDGQVYFMESYPVHLNGTRYREGAPISCSIEDFCAYYKMTTTLFDGVIHFGTKEYADTCSVYPTSFYGAALEDGELRSQPCTNEVDSSSEFISSVIPGQQLKVSGLIENTQGEWWYQVDGDTTSYILAQQVLVRQFLFDDVTVQSLQMPTVLKSGKNHQLKGNITSEENSIYSVRAQIYKAEGDGLQQICAASEVVDDQSYQLKGSTLAKGMPMKELDPGSYRYELAVVSGSYYIEDQQLKTHWETVTVWNSDFQVTEKQEEATVVAFEGDGTSVEVDSRALVVGEPIGQLPTPKQSGRVFLGWFTHPEGGEQITADYIPQDDMTVYAQWSSPRQLQDALTEGGQCWYFYTDGAYALGYAQVDGNMYYFADTGVTGQSDMVWTTVQ